MLNFDTDYVIDRKASKSNIIKKYNKSVTNIANAIKNGKAIGCEMTGWLHPEELLTTKLINDMIKKANQWINANIKNVVIIGIGGSYIGVKAAIDMVLGDNTRVKMHYIHNINSNFIASKLAELGNQKFGIIVISKSGTTLEPAVSFRIFRKHLEDVVGVNDSKKYIVAITDPKKGTLHNYAEAKCYKIFPIPSNIGGRYSTLTPVGIFPMIVAGINVNKLLKGAKQAISDLSTPNLRNNSAYLYAAYRHYFHMVKKIQIENFITYDPYLTMIGCQWQQLFGESEGKAKRGMYPAYSLFTTDLHALGQYLQEGTRNFIETTLIVSNPKYDIKMKINDNNDGLKYLNNKTLDFITKKAFKGTIEAHSQIGKVNNFVITINKSDEYHYGYLFIWLSHAAMMSAYLLKLNPFDQPGVESYKKNMFKLLGRE